MNKALILGRLTKDVDLRRTQNGMVVASLTLAVNRPTKEKETDFIPVVLWGKTAEVVEKYVHKGQRLLVEGRIQVRNYEGNDGKKHYVTEVVGNNVEFLEKKEDTNETNNPFGTSTDEDIPF